MSVHNKEYFCLPKQIGFLKKVCSTIELFYLGIGAVEDCSSHNPSTLPNRLI